MFEDARRSVKPKFELGELVVFLPETFESGVYTKRGYLQRPDVGSLGTVMDKHIFEPARWHVYFPSEGKVMLIHQADLQKDT